MDTPGPDSQKLSAHLVSRTLAEGGCAGFVHLLASHEGPRAPFPFWDGIGRAVGAWVREERSRAGGLFPALLEWDPVAGSVITATAMIAMLDGEVESTLEQARRVIAAGGAWYVCDIFGVRVVGEALLGHFDRALRVLETWIADENAWVRRTVGVAVHYFAKRAPEQRGRNRRLVRLLLREVESRETSVVKGVGWGLETVARYNPELFVDTLCPRLRGKRLSALMRKKIRTKLPPKLQARIDACLEGDE